MEYFLQGVGGQKITGYCHKGKGDRSVRRDKNVLKMRTVLVSIGQDDAAVLKRPSLMILPYKFLKNFAARLKMGV